MRKAIFISGILVAVLLMGCFGFFKKEKTLKPAAQERQASGAPQVPGMAAQNGQTAVPEPPSFQDGDFYLQALSSKDSSMCAKIQNTKLRDRCEIRVGE